MEQLYRVIGGRIRDLREERRLSQQALAQACGMGSRASIYNIECGNQRPPLHVYYRLASALQTSLVELLPEELEELPSTDPLEGVNQEVLNNLMGSAP